MTVGEQSVGGVEVSSARSATARLGEGYRPHLDGLRTVAVYLVLLFHAGADRFSGGFVGVDVFFVLSGYLVTQLLMRDLTGRGSLRFGRFYARRFRRLLPAAFVALIATAIVYTAIASQSELSSTIGAFKAAFLYSTNWYFIHQSSDYFAADVNANPVQQFWSLAVEEQFYFVWPILLATLFAVTRRLRGRRERAMQLTVAAAGVISAIWALYLASTNVSRSYYGTDTRAYQLLAGAFLALSPGLLYRIRSIRLARLLAPMGVVSIVLLATSVLDMNPVRRGVATTVAAMALIAGTEALPTHWVTRLVSSSPAAYLGKISYGIYLWHWPVILVALAVTDNKISPTSNVVITALVATGLASLSYQMVEMPIRRQQFLDRINPMVIASGLAISGLAALVLIPNIIDPYQSRADAAQNTSTVGLTPIPKFDFAKARSDVGDLHVDALPENCLGKPVTVCTPVKGKGVHVLVIGDSHAQMMDPTFAKLAQQNDLTSSEAASGGCPWQRNLYLPDVAGAGDEGFLNKCIAFKKDLYERVIPALKPDLIVAWSNDYLTRRPGVVFDESGRPMPSNGSDEFQKQFEAETTRSITLLRAQGAKILIAEAVPTTTQRNDPFVCLTKNKFLEDCRFVSQPRPSALDKLYARAADNKNVFVANFNRLVCPFMPICDPVIGGVIVRFDNQHLTPKYATSLAAPMADYLTSKGLIPG